MTLHRQTQGWGPIGQAGLSGFFLHSCLAVAPDGVPLGLLGGTIGARQPESRESHRPHKHRPLAEKDRRRGVDLMDEATADISPTTRVMMVADRERDSLDVFLHATDTGRDVVIRAAWDGVDRAGGVLWRPWARPS